MKQVSVSFRVSTELKRQMKEIDINWREFAIECIQKKLDEIKSQEARDKLNETKTEQEKKSSG